MKMWTLARQEILVSSPDSHLPGTTPHSRDRKEAPAKLPLSAGQVRAIYSAMRTFRDDDGSRVGFEAGFTCTFCGKERPLAGSLLYGDVRLCNGCATDYELLRTAGIERDLPLKTAVAAVAAPPSAQEPAES